MLPLLLAACGSAGGDSADTGGLRATGEDAWVRVRGLDWRRSGPRLALRFRTDAAVEARVCDDRDLCVPAGEGVHHAVQLVTPSSTLRIEVRGADGSRAAFGPFAISDR